ncbi:Zinc finger protein Gfi-1 [Holothuria leucospilota]|uniref:Zinc finger protein Gfi-1 n=1 Tax=Holothuria leucospilota TaxID=206669 RepID=A0A9Q0YBM0_HOLLE|nr:Zinc finger protein Gfi-1 [Holothuria leucospilota]
MNANASKKGGRKSKYTPEERRQRSQEQRRRFSKARVHIGVTQLARWARVKASLAVVQKVTDEDVAKVLLDSYESTQQGSLALASTWDVDVRNAEETRIPIEDCSMQRGESNTTTPDPKNDLFAESSWMCPEQNEADATFQNARMRDKSWSDPPAQTGSESSPAGLWIKKEIIDEETELWPNGRISGETLTKDFPGYINTNGSEVSTVDSRCHPVKSEVTAVESNCHPVKSEQTAAESICNPVVELIVIPPCQNDGDATSLDVKTEDDSPSDWSSDEEDGDSDPLGLKDGIFSEEEYRPEEDSDCGSDSDGLTGNDNTKDGEDMTPAPSVVKKEKKEKKEKEEKEEAVVNEQADAHLDVVGDLVSYLKERQASSSKPGVTMYDILMPHPMVSKEQRKGRDVEGEEEEEMKSPELSPGDGEEFGAKTDGCGTMIHLFNDVEFVEFLQRTRMRALCVEETEQLDIGLCADKPCLILVVENNASKEENEDFTPVNVTLQGKLASRWKKIRQEEGVNDVELVQLMLDRITQEALNKESGSEDDADERITVILPSEEELTEGNHKNDDELTEPVARQQSEDIDGTSQGDGTEEAVNMEQEEEEFEQEDDGDDDEDDWDSGPAGMNNQSDSDEYKPEIDSDWEEESDEVSEEDWEDEEDEKGRKRKKNKKNSAKEEDLPFKRYDMKEVAKTEGVQGDVTENRQRTRIKRLYWTEMMRSYHCKVCSYQYSSARQVSLHLLQEHSEMVTDLITFLQSKPASDSEADITMYSLVVETDPLTGLSNYEPNSVGMEGGSDEPNSVGMGAGSDELNSVGMGATQDEMNSVGMEAGYGSTQKEQESGNKENEKTESGGTSSKGSKSDNSGSKDISEGNQADSFDDKEFVTLLLRWVDVHVTCQYCQKEVCRAGIYTPKGKEVVHQCRTNELDSVLCDICGKSFSYTIFRSHWKDVHGEAEQAVCPYCGRMYRASSMSQHINNKHNSKMKNRYPCGICGKGFKNKSARKTHEAIHKKDKPHMCTYCGRKFTQASNMRYHMRQHTGEKPYRCDTCHVSFTHNVSLKNHLKKQHGIDLWEMGYTGGGRPKKQKVQEETAE